MKIILTFFFRKKEIISAYHLPFQRAISRSIMRLNLIALSLGIMLGTVNAFTFGQQITLKRSNTSFEQLVKELEKQSGHSFFYKKEDVSSIKSLSVDFRAESLKSALDNVAQKAGLAYDVFGNTVVFKKQKSTSENTYRIDREDHKSFVELKAMQQRITGKVIDDNAKALKGVTIRTVPGDKTVMTDGLGSFEIFVDTPIDSLRFSYLGYHTLSHYVGTSNVVNAQMKLLLQQVDDVVVTGIFERKAESFTGAATVIKKEELMRNGSVNVLQSLKNIDPSFRIVENLDFGSDPNRMPEIQIRGQQSIPDIKGSYTGNPNQPLFILDGFEAEITTVFDLDMNRIETIVLLKDAAAKAIYGARAANGVVVIETRKPEKGKLRVSYKGDLNITIPDLTGYNLANAMEKYQIERDNPTTFDPFFKEQYLNNVLSDITRGVDTYWLSQPLRTGFGDRHSAYLEGGDEYVQYGVDLLYNNARGVMIGSGRKTFTGGFSLAYRYRNFSFKNQFNISQNKAEDSPYGNFSDYVALNPYWSPYHEDGSLKQVIGTVGGGGLVDRPIGNPLWNGSIGTKNFSKYMGLTNNFYMEWQALHNLKLTGRLGLTKNLNVREDFYPASHTRFANYEEERFFERGTYNKSDGQSTSVRADLNANYSLSIDRHQFFLNGGFNLQENTADQVEVSVIGFPNERMDFIAAGKEYPINGRPSGSESINRELGFLSALNYSYDDRYLADLSIRATGSSMFGKDKRWGQFWSSGIGWNLHKEHFLSEATWLTQFKLRASTGFTGSQNFNPYQALATFGYYQSQAYDNWVGSYLLGLPNDDLKWQKTQDYNIGADLNILGRFSVRYDYYIQDTKDQLLNLTIPPSMGFTTYKENLGNTQNKGMELRLGAQLYTNTSNRSFVNAFVSMATNTNKIMKISNALKSFNDANDEQLAHGNSAQVRRPLLRYEEGQSMNAIWAVRSLGIDPATGNELFLTKDGVITNNWNVADQMVVGDAMPKYNGTFGINVDYKGVFLNMTFYYRLGGQMYNQTLVDRVENADIALNVDRRIYDAVWKNTNDHVAFSYNRYKVTKPTSRFVQDLSELQLSVLNIGYDFKNHGFLKNWGLEQFKTSFYMNDVFRASSVKIERGLTYPFAQTYSFSIQATF